MVIGKTLPFIILILLFTIYLLWKGLGLGYVPPFLFRNVWIDRVLVAGITALGYSLGIHIYWVAAFFVFFMGALLLINQREKGTSIRFIHPYETYPEKKEEQLKKAVIPLHIYQTWHTKRLPTKMKECVERLQQENPEFSHHLFDEEDCRKYIATHFDKDVAYAYDQLVPAAFKADLWRYCVLYKDGGIYMDIKLQCEPNFKLLELVDKEYLVLDRPHIKTISINDELAWLQSPYYSTSVYSNVDSNIWENETLGIYNAFMVCKAGNPFLKECIDNIVENTKKKKYGHNQLYPTGPGLLGNLYFRGNREKIHSFHLFNSLNGDCILSKEKKILSHYPEYRSEQAKHGKKHYNELWANRAIYKD